MFAQLHISSKLHLSIPILYFSLLLIFHQVGAERILAVALMSCRSHKITYEPLLEELASRGHHVTILSPRQSSRKSITNIREIDTTSVNDNVNLPNIFEMKERNIEWSPLEIINKYTDTCISSLRLPQVQKLRKEKFDLIFVPAIFNECGMGYAYTFNTTMVIISAAILPETVASFYGNPDSTSFLPSAILELSYRMNFYERMVNFVVGGILSSHYTFRLSQIEEAYRQILNNTQIPSVKEIIQNSSLILTNSHFSLSYPRPYLPNIIEVGGMHCHEPNPLPNDLEKFVNSSDSDGFILFSMGSALKMSVISNEKRMTLIRAFAKLKQKILWKWEIETMPDLPKNVKLSKWLPQQNLLGHSKIRAFVTHGGFGSTTEAVYHGVPVIGIPMFGDQHANMKFAEDAGFGIRLDFTELTEEKFIDAVERIVNVPTYKENVLALSRVFRDQPEKPLGRAVFWTEYVMRHQGAVHMRSAGMNLNFFQFHSLDVIGFLILITTITLYLVFIIIRLMFTKINHLLSRTVQKEKEF